MYRLFFFEVKNLKYLFYGYASADDMNPVAPLLTGDMLIDLMKMLYPSCSLHREPFFDNPDRPLHHCQSALTFTSAPTGVAIQFLPLRINPDLGVYVLYDSAGLFEWNEIITHYEDDLASDSPYDYL